MPFLHHLYRISGLLSAVSLTFICGLILAQVVARNLGTTVRDAEEFAAWAMSAAGFFGLPYALHQGAHIRVAVVTRFVPKALHHPMEVASSVIGLVLACYLAWYCSSFVLESWRFKELSQGLVPVPMWIPQLPMVIGSVLLAVAFAERLLCVLRRRPFEVGSGDDVSSQAE
ncbi:MAG: TRAP transporter small permease [Hydrogenophaga sp.]|uniref:TRAP transporter small permease n=1 Tax=Hydrogenophaga sp. TaxID=1904254 RepID=UPI002ABB7286|nr:TRAP transporter small permease [Hydrogenophaga sp.]MDZ4101727.1 TRAP transporter small permease [Hydrogenophaga sp.]